jgi:DnaJ like chaperone protein
MGLLGTLLGGTVGFMLGGPLGAVLGGAIGSQIADPSSEQLGGPGQRMGQGPGQRPGNGQSSGPFGWGSRTQGGWPFGFGRERIVGRCPNCGHIVSFAPGDVLICPRCSARLRFDPGLGGAAWGGAAGTAGSTGSPGSAGTNGRTWGGARGSWSGARGASGESGFAEGTAQSAFMVALISLAARVAKADGQVSDREVRAFDAFLREDLGMPAEERKIAARIFNEARNSPLPTSAFTGQIRGILGAQPDRLRDLVALLVRIAWADGDLQPVEEKLLRSIAVELGLPPRAYEDAKALYVRSSPAASYAILGLEPTASDEEIKKSYRRLAKEYHPDVLQARGLPPDFLKYANEKLQAINEAYGRIKQQRGF